MIRNFSKSLIPYASRMPSITKRSVKRWIYRKYLKIEKDSIVIHSIPKSGTTYLRLFLTNYLKIYFDDIEEPITYRKMTKMFPNLRENLLNINNSYEYQQPDSVIGNTPYKDLIWGHSITAMELCEGKTVYLYRNPLDTIISQFYFYWKYREGRENLYDSPREVIDIVLNEIYIKSYNFIAALSKKHNNFLRISYESMMMDPINIFNVILNWLHFPFDHNKCKKAIEFASFKNVRKEEEENGPIGPIPTPSQYKGKFTRSGKIGQWKNYFTEEDILKVENILNESMISLSEFILE